MRPRRAGQARDAAARAEASVRALEQGGLPLAAQERLRGLRERGGGFFTSDLSTNEFLLAREGGFRPLTQVMGSCFYHVGWQGVPVTAGGYRSPASDPVWGWQGAGAWGRGQTFELSTPTEAWNEARRLALGRLAEEARLAGADAVVAVRLESGGYEWAQSLIEVVAVGTAVAGGVSTGEPRLSNLSGQEFATLREAGWAPAGLVAATSVCFVVTGWKQQRASSWMGTAWQNQELPDFTRGVSETRTQAMQRLRRQAGELGAHGVVGVSFDVAIHEYEANDVTNLIVTVHVTGTAVIEVEERDPTVYVAVPLT